MLAQIRPALVATAFFTLLLGVAYPLAVTGIARLMPAHADGSMIVRDGQVVGSALIAQPFKEAKYLHPRPSAAGADGYDASGSSGSNLGPMNDDLAKRQTDAAATLKAESRAPIPADAVTTSGSGLDPDISPANALRQAPRVAAARAMAEADVRAIIARNTTDPWLGFIGQARVNVLQANLALDAAQAKAHTSN